MAYMTAYNLEWEQDQPTHAQVLHQLTVLRDNLSPSDP